jgi:hypothetical protein
VRGLGRQVIEVGRKDKDYQKLRAERAGYPDEDDDPAAPPAPAPKPAAAQAASPGPGSGACDIFRNAASGRGNEVNVG